MSSIRIVITGTDPDSGRGGIAYAIRGFRLALMGTGYQATMCVTYSPGAKVRKFAIALKGIGKLVNLIARISISGRKTIVWAHAGAGASLVREGVVIRIASALGAKTVIQLHAQEVKAYRKSRIGRWLLRFATGHANRVAVLSNYWVKCLEGLIESERIVRVPNAASVSTSSRNARPRRSHGDDVSYRNLNILTMTRLVKEKNVDDVIRAMQFLGRGAKLYIAGTGSERASLERLVDALSLNDRVEFLGWLSDDDKHYWLTKADVFCLASQNESFGMGFIEAMACGLPIVGVWSQEVAEIVPDGHVGRLVERASPRLLAEALGEMVDIRKRRQFGRSAFQLYESSYSPQSVARAINDVIESMWSRN